MMLRNLALTVGLLAATAATASADTVYPVYNNYVTDPADLATNVTRGVGTGLTGSGAYTDFGVEWTITQNSTTGVWTYNYTFADTGSGNDLKNISHLILELSAGATLADFTGLAGTVGTYDPADNNQQGQPNPGLPGIIYGTKVDGGSPSLTLSFTTNRAPVWGNFYVKDGNNTNYAYNTGFTNLDSTNKQDFIARPDGATPVVPEPSSLAVAGVGGIGLMILAARRRKARQG